MSLDCVSARVLRWHKRVNNKFMANDHAFQPLLGSEMPWRGSKWDKCVGVREGRTRRGAKTGSTWWTVKSPWPCLKGQVTCISCGQNNVISIHKRVVEKVGHMGVGLGQGVEAGRVRSNQTLEKRGSIGSRGDWHLVPWLWEPDGKPLIRDLVKNRNIDNKNSLYSPTVFLFYSVGNNSCTLLYKIWENCLEMLEFFFLSNCHATHSEFPTWSLIIGCRGRAMGTGAKNERGKTKDRVNSFAKRATLVIKFQAKSSVYYALSFTSCLKMHEFILHEQTQCLHLRRHTQFPSEWEEGYLVVERMLPKAGWRFSFLFCGFLQT